jgi:hypothetical protein
MRPKSHRAAEKGDELPLTKTIDPHVLPGSRNSPASYQTGKSWSGGCVTYFEPPRGPRNFR